MNKTVNIEFVSHIYYTTINLRQTKSQTVHHHANNVNATDKNTATIKTIDNLVFEMENCGKLETGEN